MPTSAVIPGRCGASNYDVQFHIGESKDPPMCNCTSGVRIFDEPRNDEELQASVSKPPEQQQDQQNNDDEAEAAAAVVAGAIERSAADTAEAAEQGDHENDQND